MTELDLVKSTVQRAVSLETADSEFTVFVRNANGEIEKSVHPFRPYIILSEALLLNGFEGAFEIVPLAGENVFKYIAFFNSVADHDLAVKFLKSSTGTNPSSAFAPYMVNNDFVQQAMIVNSIRLFAGMDFSEVRRMQFDIESLCDPAYDFPNPARETDAIILISMSDNTGWEKIISSRDMSEKEMLEDFVATVAARDPDIIEGHNLFRFDLPYIETRAKRHKVKLALGRDGSTPKKRNSRFSAAERTVNYTRYDIYGRHIADTYHLAVFYDISKRELESYGLKSIAKHFKVAAPNRVYINTLDMNELWASEPDKVTEYCLDDVRETRSIAEILSPSSFYQARIIPLSYQNAIIRGNATKIDSMFMAEYITQRCSIPAPEAPSAFEGALTDSFVDGVFDDVTHCDVQSLYPSIILSEKWIPSRDSLNIFTPTLAKLRTFRLEAKNAMKNAANDAEKHYFSSLQSTFKILINSFYGYLGFAQGFLNDYNMAGRVTARGREILASMLSILRTKNANVIEMDTDGIYFQMPENVSEKDISSLFASKLPAGIDVDFDERFKAMFAYKSKNYALLHSDDTVSVTGAALKSRGLEPFQRNYMRELMRCLLMRDGKSARKLASDLEYAILHHKLPLSELAKSETLSDSLDTYKRKMSGANPRRSAAYELAIASGRDYRQGDQISFYIIGTKKRVSVVENSKLLSDGDENSRDENIEYYLAKFEELKKKFAPYVTDDSDDIFTLEG